MIEQTNVAPNQMQLVEAKLRLENLIKWLVLGSVAVMIILLAFIVVWVFVQS